MRPLWLALVVGASACASVGPRARAPVPLPGAPWPEDTSLRWYDVEGDTAAELRQALDERGPTDARGVRHDAYTAWYVTWRFPFVEGDGGCTTGPVTTHVRVEVTLPRWRAPGDGRAQPLVRRWQRYLDALGAHEGGHRETGLAAAARIASQLPGLPPRPTCAALEATANAAAEEILEAHRRRDVDYDALTRHGATQGAVFP